MTQQEEQDVASLNQVVSDASETELYIQGGEIHKILTLSLEAVVVIVILLFVSVSLAGITIMKGKPKAILNERGKYRRMR